jgi:cytochrome c oxidase cbb3-type subunit III
MTRRFLSVALCLLLASCQREAREFRLDPPIAASLDAIALMPDRIGGAPPDTDVVLGNPYLTNAYNLNQGKQFYTWFNCQGCHADGGGVTGPAFVDGWWRYGSEAVSIFASIRDGRPHGMPAYGPRLTTEQIWQLTGYIRTIGAFSAKTAAPSRNDAMQTRPAENRAPATFKTLSDQWPAPPPR